METETYRLDLGREDLNRVSNYSDLHSLVDRVLVVDIIDSDPRPVKTEEKFIDGLKLVGLVSRNNPPTVFGLRFKEDKSGEHRIYGEGYRLVGRSPEELVLNEEDFCLRDVHSIRDSDIDHASGFKIKGLMN